MIDYGHGDDIYKYNKSNFKANFSSNVWYKGAPKQLKKELKKQLEGIENYPAPSAEELSKKIEKHHQLPVNSSLVTNGATEAFYLIAQTFKNSSVALCTPSFSEYEKACKTHNLNIELIDRKSITTHAFKTKLAFICNPNNPDGYENNLDDLSEITRKFPNTIFIIDEAYIEFTKNKISSEPLLNIRPNILIVKSLTKIFCIPGLRLGYIIGNPLLIKKIIKNKMPWNVNSLALFAGNYILNNYAKIYPDFTNYSKKCKHLKKEIQKIKGFKVIPSQTNYFIVKLSKPCSKKLKLYLIEKHQLLIRDASNFRTLDQHYIRIASQTTKKNQLLIDALKQWSRSFLS